MEKKNRTNESKFFIFVDYHPFSYRKRLFVCVRNYATLLDTRTRKKKEKRNDSSVHL